MPHGRVLLSGAPDDSLFAWLSARLHEAGYLAKAPVPAGIRLSIAPTALPIVAGLDLWHTAHAERGEALALLDAQLPPGCPLLTRCTAVAVDEVAIYAKRRARVVGFSLFGPPEEGMLIELVPGLSSTPEAVRRAAMFLGSIGLRTEHLPPGSWAVYPRMISMIVNEAAFALGEGVAPATDIDMAMRLGANYPQGVLAMADAIGLDQILEVLEVLQREYGEDRYRPAPLLRRLVRAGYTGKAVGQGFHLYPTTPHPS